MRSITGYARAAGAAALAVSALAGPLLAVSSPARAATLDVQVRVLLANGKLGRSLGIIRFTDAMGGVVIRPRLRRLRPGLHGFHVHQNPNCGPSRKAGKLVPGGGAGGHYDPGKTGKHLGPYGNGHLGDLPSLVVNGRGRATRLLFAPRLKVSDLRGRALIIHTGGDNYSDRPRSLGGGGKRVGCGVMR